MIPVDVLPDLPAARIPYGDVRLGVLVARRMWPDNPCNGHEQVMVARRPPNVDGMPPLAPDHEFVGLAILTGKRCLIWIRSGMTRTETCSTVAHEQGHWDGHEDNEPGLPVMRGDDWGDVPECEVPA